VLRYRKSSRIDPRRVGALLPCLFSNICNEIRGADPLESALEKALPDFKQFSKSHRRTACALAWNVQALAEKFSLERLGFLTLTFSDHVTDPREAQRRFHSLKTGVLSSRYENHIWVWERQKNGRIHFHLLVVLSDDIRTGFDFDGIANHDYRTANKAIRDEWAFWRKTAKLYGFGRTELLPVRSTAEGIARYVGKYISKHVAQREERDKGFKLVGYSRGARMVSARFSFVTVGAAQWRAKVGLYCRILGAMGSTPDRSPVEFEDIKRVKGPRWAFKDREYIAKLPLFDECDFRIVDHDSGWLLHARRNADGGLRLMEMENATAPPDRNA
jgi:hypothetical protein